MVKNTAYYVCSLSVPLHIITVVWTIDSQYLQANGYWWMTLSIESIECELS